MCAQSLTRSPGKLWQEGSPDIAGNLELQLQRATVTSWLFFALALDKTYDIRGTAHLLAFVRGWMDLRSSRQQCAQWKRRLPVHSFMEVHVCMAMLGVKWDSLVDVPTDSCPNLNGKSICNRKWLNSTQTKKLVSLQHIIHVLSKSMLKMNRVVHIVPKSVKVSFMRTWALNGRQFCGSFGGEWD